MVVSTRSRLGAVIPLFARPKIGPPWSNEELAQLYGVAQVLGKAGLAIDTESGLTDEGDPWFAFVRPDSDEVVAHFARIDGQVVGTGLSVAGPVKGVRLRDVVSQLLDQSRGQSFALRDETRSIILHPIVGLATFIAIGMLAINDAKATSETSAPEDEGVLRAALDFVIDHLRSHGPSDESVASESRATPGDLRAGTAAGTEVQSGSRHLQILATVVAMALSLSGDQPVAETTASAELLLAEERLDANTAGASTRADRTIVVDDAIDRSAENQELSHAVNHGNVGTPLDAEFGGDHQLAVTPASEAATQEAPPSTEPQFVFAAPTDGVGRDGGIASVAVRSEIGLIQIDMARFLKEHSTATATQALDPPVPAMVLLAGEKLFGDGKVLLAEVLETSAQPVLLGGQAYILVDFTADIRPFVLSETSPLHQAAISESVSPISEEGDSSPSAVSLPEGDAKEASRPLSAEIPSAPTRSVAPLVLDTPHIIDVPSGKTETVALSAGVETVLFNGGNVRVEHFQFGVDKLLVASPLLDWSKAAIIFKGADAVIQFDPSTSVTLVGVLAPYETAA